MRPLYQPTKRKRKSQFDPYIETITDIVKSGATLSRIADELEPYFDDAISPDSLYTFIKRRGLKSKNGGHNINVQKCCNCSDCLTVADDCGRHIRICLRSKRVISRSSQTSPLWCHLRERQAG